MDAKLKVFDWHVDNYNEFDGVKDSSQGYVYILYLADSATAGTEFLLNSHRLSSATNQVNFASDDSRLGEFQSVIVQPSAGDLHIARVDLIPRGASSISDSRIYRPTLRWQSSTLTCHLTDVFLRSSQVAHNSLLATYINPVSNDPKRPTSLKYPITQTLYQKVEKKLIDIKSRYLIGKA